MTALSLVSTSSPSSRVAPRPSSHDAAVDIFVDGVNLTARLVGTEKGPLLRGLADALVVLSTGERSRLSVPCLGTDAGWEVGLERTGARVLVTLFRGGRSPEVPVFERSSDPTELMQALHLAMGSTLAGESSVSWDGAETPAMLIAVEPDPVGPLQLSCDFEVRKRPVSPEASRVERADLFSLLCRGTLRVGSAGTTREIPDAFVFPVAEELVDLAHRVLDASETGAAFQRRAELCGVVVGVRYATSAGLRESRETHESREGARGDVWLTLGRRTALGDSWTFPLPGPSSLAECVVAFGRALYRAFVRHNPLDRQNLRLTSFRDSVRGLAEKLRESARDDAKLNPTPETYRLEPLAPAKADSNEVPAPSSRAPGPAKIRYAPRWTATVPGIDLRTTFLCGDRLIVGTARETVCLDRSNGEALWRTPTTPAVCVVTPGGLARIHADGTIAVLDFGTGEPTLVARSTPRLGSNVAGVVVHAPSLPRLLIASEGRRHLSAFDLSTGEIRWRYAPRRGEGFKLRRIGKLLIVATGDPTLTALDVRTGEVVWRVRGQLRFCQQAGIDHDSLFAIAGETVAVARGIIRLYHVDPYSGRVRWTRELPGSAGVPFASPLVANRTVALLTRDPRGLGIATFDRATGAPQWSVAPGFLPAGSSAMMIDDQLVLNTDAGEVFALDAGTGRAIWRHAFARGIDGDQPRRLEPVLRSGALFIPQQEVHVVRPRDGALLGRVATDIIPDLLRVDERCDVYVAEESGHIASFRAGPRLALV